ncbi:unnamed protein product [Periconia digitata]|uniref:Uncharacterized protein n=1 Tax=Periconia digitata TaxID=1303443 RepID=A0A9W4U6P0_9PLEO|nr:unnamed protein product [Periconia digitata]
MSAIPPIHTSAHNAGSGFVALEAALRQTERPHYTAQLPPDSVRDEFDRFRIWAGNIAAHLKGRRSLEYRLRDSEHLKTETHSLLTALRDSIHNALSIVKGERKPWDEFSDSDSDSESDYDLPDNDNEQAKSELEQIFNSIKTTVTCLFRLSMAIRDPAPETQHRNTITIDKSHFEGWDITHTKSKFPDCAQYLQERLGQAISGRRNWLSYREEHHQKLGKNVELIGIEAPKTQYTSNSTEATPLPVVDRVNSFEQPLDDNDAASQTSYAASENDTFRVPRLPKVSHEQEHYECPFCFMIVSIHTKSAWRNHVYRDLHPYCCTFEGCVTADRLYTSRREWFKHELEAHRTSWQCIEGCDRRFDGKDSFESHVSASHPDLASPPMLSALKRTSMRSADLSTQVRCPFCSIQISLRGLQRHVGRHQEQLALFALPSNLDDTLDEEDTGSDEHASVDVNNWQDEEGSEISDVDQTDLDATYNDQPENTGSDASNRSRTPEKDLLDDIVDDRDSPSHAPRHYPSDETDQALQEEARIQEILDEAIRNLDEAIRKQMKEWRNGEDETDVGHTRREIQRVMKELEDWRSRRDNGGISEAVKLEMERLKVLEREVEHIEAMGNQQREHTVTVSRNPEQNRNARESPSEKIPSQSQRLTVEEWLPLQGWRRADPSLLFSIFVGNLSPNVDELTLIKLFQSRYTSCDSAKVMYDPISRISRGYGFVRFTSEEEQQRAITEMQGMICGDQPMRISSATPKNRTDVEDSGKHGDSSLEREKGEFVRPGERKRAGQDPGTMNIERREEPNEQDQSVSAMAFTLSREQSGAGIQRPPDDIIEQEFLNLIERREWNKMPEQALQRMKAYDVSKKWTLVHQDRLTQLSRERAAAGELSSEQREAIRRNQEKRDVPSAEDLGQTQSGDIGANYETDVEDYGAAVYGEYGAAAYEEYEKQRARGRAVAGQKEEEQRQNSGKQPAREPERTKTRPPDSLGYTRRQRRSSPMSREEREVIERLRQNDIAQRQREREAADRRDREEQLARAADGFKIYNADKILKARERARLPKGEEISSEWNANIEATKNPERDSNASAAALDTNEEREEPSSIPSKRAAYTKVHRKHINITTLQHYEIPFEFDSDNSDYFIIFRDMSYDETQALFEHTRRLREEARRNPDLRDSGDPSEVPGSEAYKIYGMWMEPPDLEDEDSQEEEVINQSEYREPRRRAAAATRNNASALQIHDDTPSRTNIPPPHVSPAEPNTSQDPTYRQRQKDPPCYFCQERKLKCDATETTACSECSSRNQKCLH